MEADSEGLGARCDGNALDCTAWLPVVRPHLSRSLVGPRAWARIESAARHLPGDGINVLEVRLADADPTVDLSIGLTAPAQAADLAGRLPASRSRSFLRRWGSGAADLAAVEAVWLEHDLDLDLDDHGEPRGLPEPVLCAKLHGRPPSPWVVGELLPELHGDLDADQERLARRAVEELPPEGKVLYAFSLRPRPGDAVRLELYGLDLPAMASYLRRFEPALAPRVEELAPWFAGCERPHLSFDLGREVSPRLGIEGSFAGLPHRDPRWGALFDRLVAAGLAAPAKRDAVLAWPGWDSPRTAPDVWPEARRQRGAFCARCLSHFKLVSWPGRPPEAKAYLLFQYVEKGQPEMPSSSARAVARSS